jgi:signal transduction histidine kinase
MVAAVSGLLALLNTWLLPPMVLYILVVFPVAIVWGTGLAVLTAVLSAVLYDYLFFAPHSSFDLADSRPLFGLGVFLVTAIVAGELTARLRRAGLEAQAQAVLRRVAMLVARGASPPDVCSAAAEELGKELGGSVTNVLRYEDDGSVFVLGGWSQRGEHPLAGARLTVSGQDVAVSVRETGMAARTERFDGPPGSVARALRDVGVTAGAGSPILVNERTWGVLMAGFREAGALPTAAEHRIAEFSELVATAVSNAQARDDLRTIAEEQAALRRVATRVARAAPPAEVFGAVAEEAGRLLDVSHAVLCRCDTGGAVSVLAAWNSTGAAFSIGTQMRLDGQNLITLVSRTGRAARINNGIGALGSAAETLHGFDIQCGVGVPISVEHRLWGVMIVASEQEDALPPGAENRLAQFTELVAVAIANAEAQAEVTASRARILATADETRRQIERDLHDGAQQRLVSVALQLRTLRGAMPSELTGVDAQFGRVLAELTSAHDELGAYARGIHPAIAARGGLAPALRALVRRSPVDVELDVRTTARLPDLIEVTVYYLVSEALTNTAKHAHASAITVFIEAAEGILHVLVRDNGVGGADLSRGTGLLGLKDRVAAIGGRIFLDSPREAGTTLRVELPITNADRIPAGWAGNSQPPSGHQ